MVGGRVGALDHPMAAARSAAPANGTTKVPRPVTRASAKLTARCCDLAGLVLSDGATLSAPRAWATAGGATTAPVDAAAIRLAAAKSADFM